MFSDREREDLDKLILIGRGQGEKLNSMLVINFYLSLPEQKRTEDMYDQIISYLEEAGIEIINDAVEADPVGDGAGIAEIRPFDPGKIDIDMKPMELSSIIKRIQYDEIELNTAFQRKGGLWSPQQKSQLIESLILRIPIPAFYFDGGVADRWLIIDGLQRITTLKEFVVDETLRLEGLEFFKDLEGAKFSDLPRTFTRRIEESNIIAFIVKGGTPGNVKYNIFKRINTGGLQLSPQEIRHALYQGQATDLCKYLASMDSFKKATCGSIRDDRMMDQEFALRFVAVCYYGREKYDGVPDNYLNGTMEYLNSLSCEDRGVIEQQFNRVMDAANDIWGRYAFRKLGLDNARRPINKAIYEVWCWILFTYGDDEIERLRTCRERLYEKFQELCQDRLFLAAIKASDRKSFGMRFTLVDHIVQEVLDADRNKG